LVGADGLTTGVNLTVTPLANTVAPAATYVDDGNAMYTVCKTVI
jgi:hypothetical protein